MPTASACNHRLAAICLMAFTAVSCSSPADQKAAPAAGAPTAAPATTAPAATPPSTEAPTAKVTPPQESTAPLAASPYDALPGPVRALLDKPFTGDLKEMMQHRLIRAGVVFNRTMYFIDRGVQRGMAYD